MNFKFSFRNKLKLMLFLIVGVGFCTNFIIYLSNIDKVKDEAIISMNNDNSRMTATIGIIFNKMKGLYQLHYFDFKVKDILLQSNSKFDENTRFNNARYVNDSIKHVIAMDKYLIRATIITKYGDVYSNVSYVSNDYLDFVKGEQKRNFDYKDNRTIYINRKEYIITQQRYNIITALHQLFAYNTNEASALLCVDIDYYAVLNSLKNSVSQDKMGTILILDEDNMLFKICGNDIASGSEIDEGLLKLLNDSGNKLSKSNDKAINLEYKGERYIITAVKNYETNWLIVQYKSERDVLEHARNEIFKDILWLILIAIILIFISYYFAKSVSTPLEELNKVINKNYEGHLSRIDYDTKNTSVEITNVMENYNKMVDRINNYVTEIIDYEIHKRRAEMKILKYQINPHFLLNTLNTVGSIAELSNQNEIVEVVDNLSEILKYTLYGESFVALKDELNAINSYIEIQKIRYPEKFEVNYEVDPSILSVRVVKFFIQPLIENTFKHGFEKINKKGRINIKAFSKGDYLIISIWDNGIGMSEEKVSELNNSFQNEDIGCTIVDESWDKNIGMKNVNARLRHYYGKESGIWVSSSQNEWTDVRVRIPI